MPKRSKLLQALDEHKGRDYDAEKQRKLVKAARKRKGVSGEEEKEAPKLKKSDLEDEEENGISDEEEEVADNDDPESQDGNEAEASNQEEDEEDEEEEDIPLSDLEDADLEDVIPHQRLTINNSTALTASTKRISFISHLTPFAEHNSLTSSEEISIPDPNDDLNRELAFYKVAQSATLKARGLLKKEGISFTRPGDYFAEMVKTDEHMGKIKKKLYEEAAGKKAAAEARKQRDLKKFGKQVQVAKLQQRAKEKKESLEKINELKKKRKADTSAPDAGGADDLFDVAVEDALQDNKHKRGRAPEAGGPSQKRQKKNEKFGFGGKKRFAKSGDAASTGDMRGFSAKKMKGGPKGGSSRPGKSKRAAAKGRN
ncbi:eukaryotic rRNA processing protein EBP2-domain-containing protein [Aspergillus cavernicola]|uniref:Eukaryotic rRNA processing protein EBP2-domain-containing protein n=1 Tax=Aspergillus cavernicola TaxID=176166 RepID=A0ABR4IQF4_9EURO